MRETQSNCDLITGRIGAGHAGIFETSGDRSVYLPTRFIHKEIKEWSLGRRATNPFSDFQNQMYYLDDLVAIRNWFTINRINEVSNYLTI